MDKSKTGKELLQQGIKSDPWYGPLRRLREEFAIQGGSQVSYQLDQAIALGVLGYPQDAVVKAIFGVTGSGS